jgi:hypothetical protein
MDDLNGSQNTFGIPASLIEKVGFSAVLERLSLQSCPKLAGDYSHVNLEFYALIIDRIRFLLRRQRTELRKELASIASRKQFIFQCQEDKAHSLLIEDAILHSTPEYQNKLQRQLKEIDAFLLSISAHF